MPILEINGRDVEIDDSFLSMSPEMQNQTVDEIASSPAFQNGAGPQTDPRIEHAFAQAEAGRGDAGELFSGQLAGMDETDISIARSKNTPLGGYLRQQAEQQRPGETPQEMQQRQYGGLQPRPEHDGPMDKARTFVHNTMDGVPIVGEKIADHVAAAGVYMANPEQGYDASFDAAQALSDQDRADNPYTAMAGQFTGAVAPLVAAGATSLGAKALGVAGKNLGTRAIASGASGAALSGANTIARGGSTDDAILSGGISAGVGAMLPIVGAGVRAAGRGVANKVGPVARGLINPEKEAALQVGRAMNVDDAAGRLTAADEVTAQQFGQPVINADRGGEQTLALVRSITNQSPTARQKIASFAGDRYASQSDRATGFLSRVMGGSIDDLAAQDALTAAARASNKPAYAKAFADPKAQSMWTPRLQELMQSPAMQDAAKKAAGRGANRAAVAGFKPIMNPFRFKEDGTYTLFGMGGGKTATPSLQFWDQAKRNLDSAIGTAQRSGDKALTGDLQALKTALVKEMDSAVPAYAKARKGASAFFDAEDALTAGKKFVNLTRGLPETRRAMASMGKAEKEAFATGFASEIKDKILQAGDSVDLVKRIFGSPEARQKVEIALGPERFKQFEGFMRVETTMNALKNALGNSTTARQFIELGLAGGGGYVASGGDWKAGATTAMLAFGARKGITKANDATVKTMADLLLSDSPARIGAAMKMAGGNKKAQEAVTKVGLIARAMNVLISRGDQEPLQVTVPVGSNQPQTAQ